MSSPQLPQRVVLAAQQPQPPPNPVALINASLTRHGLTKVASAAGVTLVVKHSAAPQLDAESLRLLLVHNKVLLEHPDVNCDFLLLSVALMEAAHRFHEQLVGSATAVLSWQRSTTAYTQMLKASSALSLLEHMSKSGAVSDCFSLQPTDVDCLYHIAEYIVKRVVLPLSIANLRVAAQVALLCGIVASSWRVLLMKSALGGTPQQQGDTAEAVSRTQFARFAKFIVSEDQWASSAFTFTLLSGYQDAILGLVVSLTRGVGRKYFDNADDSAAGMFVSQLAAKPLSRAAIATGIFSRIVRKGVKVSSQSFVFHQLSLLKRALAVVERQGGHRLTSAIVRKIRELAPDHISYYHIFTLGMLEQFPHISLANDADLVRRARNTYLCDEDTLSPRFCRFVLAMMAGECLGSKQPQDMDNNKSPFFTGRSADPFLPSEVLQLFTSAVQEISQVNAVARSIPADARFDELVPFGIFAQYVLSYSSNLRQLEKENETVASFELKLLTIALDAALMVYATFVELSAKEGNNFSKFPRNVVDVAFRSHQFLRQVVSRNSAAPDHAKIALETVASTFPIFFFVASSAPKSQEKVMLRSLQSVTAQLAGFSSKLSTSSVNAITSQLANEYIGAKSRNRTVLYRLLGYCSTLREKDFVRRVANDTLVKSWVPLSLSGITNTMSVRLAEAAHDVLVAPMIHKRSVAPIFAPTYTSLFAPDVQSRYGPPSLPLLRRFATHVRRVCQGLEQVDEEAMAAALQDPTIRKELGSGAADLSSVTPISSALIVVQSVYENCTRLNAALTKSDGMRRDAYRSALFNLVQVSSALLTSRACAACESLLMSMTRAEQVLWLGFLTKVVESSDNLLTKKGLVEWLIQLEGKVLDAKSLPQKSKL